MAHWSSAHFVIEASQEALGFAGLFPAIWEKAPSQNGKK